MNTRVKNLIDSAVLVFLLVLITGANPIVIKKAQAEGEVLISIIPSVSKVAQEDQFSVDIVVDPNGNNINGIQFDFEFDPSLVQVDSLDWGDLVGSSSFYTEINNVDGIINGIHVFPDVSLWDSDIEDYTFGLTPFTLATVNLTADASASGTSYLRLSTDTVYSYDGTNYTDNSIEARSSGGTPFTILSDTDDLFYIGTERKFEIIHFELVYSGQWESPPRLLAEYYSTDWSPLTIHDSTKNLLYSGNITFTSPDDWMKTSVNGVNKYWVRLKDPDPVSAAIPTVNLVRSTNTIVLKSGVSADSALSYIVTHNSIIIDDTIAPADITDLSVSSTTTNSITLTWTAPGDNGSTGTAASYDIRYSTSEITEDNWDSASQVADEPSPSKAGTSETKTVSGLASGTTYYFAIKTSDEVPNTSGISNVISGATQSSGGGGGGGGGGIPRDTTPPAKPTNFKAVPSDSQIVLSWKNPTDSDFVRTKILRKEEAYPTNQADGKVVYDGDKETYTDTGLTNNITYYYSAFSYDEVPNYSQASKVSATPKAEASYPDGTLLKGEGSPKIYVIKEGKKKWIKTAEEFIAGGYKWEDVKTISQEELDSIPDYTGGTTPSTYPDGTLLKTPESFKVYVIINQKKKWIPTPEVFETLGYQWGSITIIDRTKLAQIPDYEDNLIRTIGDYKVYLIVNGIKRHIPNPEIFLNYGFSWDDVKDVSKETVNQYKQACLVKESRQEKVYYLSPKKKIKRWLRSPEIFSSYNNKWEDIQVISKFEMDFYPESNLIRLQGDNKIYLIGEKTKRWIPNAQIFNAHRFDWNLVMVVNEIEFGWFARGENVR